MIEIDGAIGYGQVLRTAIALSALMLRPIRIFNIRKGRPKPGLMAQHLTGVKIAGEFCNADIKGLQLGSTEVEFIPKSFAVSDKKIDIGTAGQISLLLQTLTPLLIFSKKPVNLEIVGGTAGLGAPTIQYIKHVTFPLLTKLGVKMPEIEIDREGFYPKGGGRIKIKFQPVEKLNAIEIMEQGEIKSIKGLSICGKLPEKIAERQADAARKKLLDHGFEADIEHFSVNTLSPGTSITLWAECQNTILGADKIGKRGMPAEKIGQMAAMELIKSIQSGAGLDKFMADQIIPFLALADGRSKIKVEEITKHCRTNMVVTEQILGVKFDVKDKIISVNGLSIRF